MKSSIKIAALAVTATLCCVFASSQSRAATVNIDFTFTNTSTSVTITGEIDGLTVGGTSPGSAVIINSYIEPPGVPSGAIVAGYPYSTYPYAFPLPLLITPSSTPSFTVDASGVLTDAHFFGTGFFDTTNYVQLSLDRVLPSQDVAGLFQYVFPPGQLLYQSGGDFGRLIYTTVPVAETPLPAALPLFASGAGVIGLLVRRRKRKSGAIGA
jgi:hypothetical protein